jgi:acetyl-CoA decarbonylase/synthase complex subunit gamma
MRYLVSAGLYALGAPGPHDPVVVTANYKMSYDLVRQALTGRNIWLLVLETFGINVWCAAGKGTFGIDELVARIETTGLERVVSHRRLLLPIMGAVGVAAHQVARRTGFNVRYATLRVADLPLFLDNGMVTTPEMRELTFTFRERLVLIPVEFVLALRWIVFWGGVLVGVALFTGGMAAAMTLLTGYLGAVAAGMVVAPLLLPWLPGNSFSVKGAVTGLVWSALWWLAADGARWGIPATLAAFLLFPAISAFYALNFTGCTTFTSRSGVKKEMRLALPVMGGAVVAGVLLVLVQFLQ